MKKLFTVFGLLAITGFDANAQIAYMPNYLDSTVSVINVTTNTVTHTINVGNGPLGVAASPDGSMVYVTINNDSVVRVISTATNTVIASIPVGVGSIGVTVSPDGSRAYVTSGADSLCVINTATNTVTDVITVGLWPQGVAVSPDGSKVYVANSADNTVNVIDAVADTVTDTIAVGTDPTGISITPDGSKVYVTNYGDSSVSVISSAANVVLVSVHVGKEPFGVAISPDGSKVYVTNTRDSTVSVISSATDNILANITVGNFPEGISVSPDGNKVYVANSCDSSVYVISTALYSVTDTINVGSYPIALGNFISIVDTFCSAQFMIVPDTNILHHYYVVNNASGVQPMKYLWGWGDGTYDSIAYPTHNYDTAGTYTICLTITDSTGCTSMHCDTSFLQKSGNSAITMEVIPSGTLGINENELSDQVLIYPNPAVDKISIALLQKSEVSILNTEGQIVKRLNANKGNATIDISEFAKGMYFVKAVTDKGIAVKKFVKE